MHHRPLAFLSRRIVWHTLGIVIAIAVAWMIFRAYREPEFLLDLMNMSWCAFGAFPIGRKAA